jgi:hypothetical protein
LEKFSGDLRLQTMLATGRVKDAADDEALKEALTDPWNALAVSIAWSVASDSGKACSWREKAAAALDRLDADSKRAARLLRVANPPGKAQLDDVALNPFHKSLLVVALIDRFPQDKASLAPIARNLNVGRYPPYHLVHRAIDGSVENELIEPPARRGEKGLLGP